MFTLNLPAWFPAMLVSSWVLIALLSVATCGLGVILARWIQSRSLPLAHAILLLAILTPLLAPLTLAGSLATGLSPIRLVASAPAREIRADASRLLEHRAMPQVAPWNRAASSEERLSGGPWSPPRELPTPGAARTDVTRLAAEGDERKPTFAADLDQRAVQLRSPADAIRIVSRLVVGIWLAGTSILLVRLIRGLFRVRQFERTILRESDPELLRMASEVSRQLGMSCCPPLGRSRGLDVPVSLGLPRPQVVLPMESDEESWPAETWRPLLVHELAHIHRRDHIVGLVQRLAVAFYWWNPLVHASSRELSLVREQICDDVATSVIGTSESTQRQDYATLLVDLAERATERAADRLGLGTALAAWNGPTDDLARRIQRLLDPHRHVATSLGKMGRAAISAFALVMFLSVMVLNVRVETLLALTTEAQVEDASARTDPAKVAENDERAGRGEANDDGRPVTWLEKAVRVVNDHGDPVAGATVTPWGMNTRGAGMSWTDGYRAVQPNSFTTDERGIVRVKFPQYAVARERIVPENLTCRIEHPDYASSNMELVPVTTTTLAQTTTIRVNRGAQVVITSTVDDRPLAGGSLLVDWSARAYNPRLMATITEAGTARLPRLSPGIQMVRVIHESEEGSRYYSAVERLDLVEGQELELNLALQPGIEVQGKLSDTVPRPVKNGRVIAVASDMAESIASLTWYTHAPIDEEGNFTLEPLPRGILQIIAICDGFMAKSGEAPLEATEQERLNWESLTRPQFFTVGNAPPEVTIEMTPTAMARIRVTSPNGEPISQAQVAFSPNIFWWQGGSQLYGFPLISSWEMLQNPRESLWQWTESPYFAMTDQDGVAIVNNVPPGDQLLAIDHDQFQLPSREPHGIGRYERVQLTAKEDHHFAFVLEPRGDDGLGDAESVVENVYCGPGVSHIIKPRPTRIVPTRAAETELAGVVIDVDGRPLAGVKVDVWTWHPGNETTTDDEGRFRLTELERLTEVEVEFSKLGYCPSLYPAQKTGTQDWTIVLTRDTYLEGQVLDPQGQPVADALIRASRGPFQNPQVHIGQVWTETTTDAEGRYRLYLEPYDYDVQVRVPRVGSFRQSGLKVTRGSMSTLDLQLQQGITFRARVRDARTGDPIPGIQLWHWQHEGVEGTSDEDGNLEIDGMSPGEFEFMVTAEGVDRRRSSLAGNYARWWSSSAVHEHEREELVEEGRFPRNLDGLTFNIEANQDPLEIFLEPAVTIRGRVVDPEGEPVKGATVAPAKTGSGNSLTGDTRYSYSTDEQGRFTMYLPASRHTKYNLIAHDGEYNQWRNWASSVTQPFQTDPGQVLEDVELRLERGATVRGRVLDREGHPKPFKQVRAVGTDGLDNRYYVPTTKTDEQGNYELKFIRPGEHRIQVEPFWLAADQAPGESSHTVTVRGGDVREKIDFVVE